MHGSVARWEGDRLTLWDTNQGPFPIQSQLAAALKMPLSKVRVISPYMGGGFGSVAGAFGNFDFSSQPPVDRVFAPGHFGRVWNGFRHQLLVEDALLHAPHGSTRGKRGT